MYSFKLWCLFTVYLQNEMLKVQAQIPWNMGSTLNRVPGLHPVGGGTGYPQFLLPQTGYTEIQERRCPSVSHECPRACRHVDEHKCRVCKCDNQESEMTSYLESSDSSCPPIPRDCPALCRKVDKHECKVCICEKDGQEVHSLATPDVSGTMYKRCHAMIMCMLSCKVGYTLGTRSDSNGCQPCHCVNTDGNDNKGPSETGNDPTNQKGADMGENGLGVASSETWASHWTSGSESGMSSWSSSSGSAVTHENHAVSSSSSHGATDNRKDGDVWSVNNGVVDQSSGCTGPMCPGSTGINPMSPGTSMSSASSSSSPSSCTGPFCLGQDGGMGGISAGGGAMGGMMGGPGGVGAFSPFGLAAGGGGNKGGCSGPFCTVMGGSAATGSEPTPAPA